MPRYKLRTLLYAYYQLYVAWLMTGLLWLFVPLFMLANIAVFCGMVKANPLLAAGTLAAGQAIGMIVLWTATWVFKAARRDSIKTIRGAHQVVSNT